MTFKEIHLWVKRSFKKAILKVWRNDKRTFGFQENVEDNCIYSKFKNEKFIFLILYVDDILLASSDVNLLHEIKEFLSSNFDMKDLGEASYVWA